jgi:hypothetical protein
MPKITKKIDPKDNVEDIIIDESVSEDEVEEEVESESEEEIITTEGEKKKQKKLNSMALFSELVQRFNSIEEAEAAFIDKEKTFEKEQKEFINNRKKTLRDINGIIKRLEKTLSHDIVKKNPRKTENAGKGGFNKQVDVPELLRAYIGIKSDEKKSRPEVTKLLNAKFSEAGLMKSEPNDAGKDIKVIVLDKATAKKLKRPEGTKIPNKDIQTFIAQFYKEMNETTINA